LTVPAPQTATAQGVGTLGASVADDTTDIQLTDKRQVKIQPIAKLKELQADTQANAFATHLILPNRTNASWTYSYIRQTP
jgi:hypothetical protein